MIDEKKKIDVSRDRLLVHILNGGKIDEIDDEPDGKKLIPGVDYPATNTL